MLAAAFPRSSWTQASEAVYVMALADEGVDVDTARQAVRKLVREVDELPTIHRVLMTCRAVSDEAAGEEYMAETKRVTEAERQAVREAAARVVRRLNGGTP